VIATDHGGARETVIDGETGWLTKPGDAKSLAAAIGVALDQSEEGRKAFASRCVSYIRENFSKDQMCGRTLDIYEEVLSERGRTQ